MKTLGIVDQVSIAFSPGNRRATVIGALLGAFVPLASFAVAHYEVRSEFWMDPRSLLVLGGLVYSARTVYQWGQKAFRSWFKALGFTVLIEGVMVGSSQEWLTFTALVYLCAINAIATGVTLTRDVTAPVSEAAPASPKKTRPKTARPAPVLKLAS